MSLSFTILGCGSSGGVPRVAQGWGACDPNEPRNTRRRCSALVERTSTAGKTSVLIDTSPDLRMQLLGAGVTWLDGVLMTHAHADHVAGIDDLRALVLVMRRRIDMHMDTPTSRVVLNSYSYIFHKPAGSSYPPILSEKRLEPGASVEIDGKGGAIQSLPFVVNHGESDALGFRFGGLAYTPDANAIPPAAEAALQSLDVWVVDALRYAPHPSHFTLDETLAWIEKLKPRKAILTNLHTDLDYATLCARLPAGVEPAYDGMRIEF